MLRADRGTGTLTSPDQRGAALVVSLMAIVLLSTIGCALVLLTSAETAIASHFQSGTEALYAAETALGRVTHELRATADWTAVLDGTVTSAFVDGSTSGVRALRAGTLVDLGQVVNQANCRQSHVCTAADLDRVSAERPWGANNPRWRVFACGPLASLLGVAADVSGLYVIVLVGDDGAENDGDPARDGITIGAVPNLGLGVVELRAEVFAASGIHRVVQATVSRFIAIEPGVGPVPEVRILAWREMR